MKKVTMKGSALLSPVPCVMVTSGSVEVPNVMTVGWTGIINTQPPKTYISLRKSRYTHELVSKSREFVINLTTESLVRAADICGVRSGKDVDKFSLCGLTAERASEVSAPMLAQSPVSVECRVSNIIELGTHDMFIADIVAVNVDGELISKSGRIEFEKAGLVAYSHGEYFALGKKLGSFGYSVRKKKKKSPVRAGAPSGSGGKTGGSGEKGSKPSR